MVNKKSLSTSEEKVPKRQTKHTKTKTKVKKNKKKSEKNYSAEALKQALEAIEQGKSLRKVSSTFGVPKSTLHAKYNGYTPIDCRKGPTTILTKEEEEKIVDWILECGRRGFPVNRSQLLDCVQNFVLDSGRETPFKDGRSGKYWYSRLGMYGSQQGFAIYRDPLLFLTTDARLTEGGRSHIAW